MVFYALSVRLLRLSVSPVLDGVGLCPLGNPCRLVMGGRLWGMEKIFIQKNKQKQRLSLLHQKIFVFLHANCNV